MMAKLLEVLQGQNQNQNSDDGNPFAAFDLESFRRKAAQTLRTSFRSLDEKSKRDFLAWISSVRSIRNADLSYREKETRIAQLRNTEMVMQTLKAILDAAVRNTPEQEQKMIKTSLTGIGVATSLLKWQVPPLALLAVGQALPKFFLTPQFEIVASFLEKELQEMLKELQMRPA